MGQIVGMASCVRQVFQIPGGELRLEIEVDYPLPPAAYVAIEETLPPLRKLLAACRPDDRPNTPPHTLPDLLEEFVDDDPCRLDHHGYCQTHSYFGGQACDSRSSTPQPAEGLTLDDS